MDFLYPIRELDFVDLVPPHRYLAAPFFLFSWPLRGDDRTEPAIVLFIYICAVLR